MISSLNGKLILKEQSYAVIECGGIGFKCFITDNTYRNIGSVGETVFLYTHLAVKEDALDLYGFCELSELETFKLITTVSGVGAKIGLALLSEFSPDKIILFVASGDAKSLTAASGVGLKLAQRIILELKDKVGSIAKDDIAITATNIGNATVNSAAKEAIEALTTLGYSQSEASLAVSKQNGDLPVDTLIKEALKSLARGFNT